MTADAAPPIDRKAQLLAELRARAGTDTRKLALIGELEKRQGVTKAPEAPVATPETPIRYRSSDKAPDWNDGGPHGRVMPPSGRNALEHVRGEIGPAVRAAEAIERTALQADHDLSGADRGEGADQRIAGGVRAGGALAALPVTMGLAALDLDEPVGKAFDATVGRAGRVVERKTGSPTLGALTEVALPVAAGAAALKGVPALRNRLGFAPLERPAPGAIPAKAPTVGRAAPAAEPMAVGGPEPFALEPRAVAPKPAPSMWRQAQLAEADALVNTSTMEGAPFGVPERFVATSRDLAIGQRGNKGGAMIEIDPAGLEIAAPRAAKPASAFVEKQGGGGERVLRGRSADVGKNVRSVTVPADRLRGYEARRLVGALEQRGWERAPNPDGSVTFRRVEKVDPAALAEAMPRAKGAPPIRVRALGSEAGAVALPKRAPIPETLPTEPAARAAAQELRSRVAFDEPKPTIGERVRGASRAVGKFARREAPIAEFERATLGKETPAGPTAQAKYAQGGSNPKAEHLFDTGEFETVKVTDKSVRQALSEMGPNTEKALSDYLLAKRQQTRYAPEELDFGISSEQAAAIVKDIEARHPKVVEAADTLAKTSDYFLSRLEKAGALSAKQTEAIRTKNPVYYVPTERIRGGSTAGAPIGGGGPFSGKTLQTVKGSTLPFRDPVPSIPEHFRRMARMVDEAETAKAMVEAFDSNPAGAAEFMREIKAPKRTLDFDKFRDEWKANRAQQGNLVGDDVTAFMEDYLKKADDGQISVNVGGKTRHFELPNRDLYEALKGLPAEATSPTMKAFLRVPGGFSKVFRAGVTTFSGGFQFAQFLRDPRHAFVMTTSKRAIPLRFPLDIAKGYARSVGGMFGRSKLGKKLGAPDFQSGVAKELGAEGLVAQDRPAMKVEIKDIVNGTPKWRAIARSGPAGVRHVADAIESGPRLAEIEMALRQKGYKLGDKNIPRDVLVEASNAGSNVTGPFKLGSTASKDASKLYAFFNARLQANTSVVQFAKQRPVAFAARVMAVSVLPRLALWMKNKDEEWYRNLPLWRKYGAWNVSENVFVPNINILDMPAVTMEAALNREGAGEVADLAIEEASPLGNVVSKPGNLLPTAVKGPTEVAFGKDAFTGRPINPMGSENMAKVAPEEVTDPTIADGPQRALKGLSKGVHDATGWSITPAELAHIARSWTGTVGREALRGTAEGETQEDADKPLLGRVVRREKESRAVEDFYAGRARVAGMKDTARTVEDKDPAKAEKFAVEPAALRQLNKLAKELDALREEYATAPGNEGKRKVADEMNALAREGLELIREIEAR